MTKYLSLLITCIWVVSNDLTAEEFDQEFSALLRQTEPRLTKLDINESEVSLRQGILGIDPPGHAMIPLLKLWQMGKIDSVELTWWRQRDRATRLTVLALFYTQLRMDVSGSPNFEIYLQLFTEEQQKERSEELKFILKNLDALRPELSKLTHRGER
jgi:hypothetical protein